MMCMAHAGTFSMLVYTQGCSNDGTTGASLVTCARQGLLQGTGLSSVLQQVGDVACICSGCLHSDVDGHAVFAGLQQAAPCALHAPWHGSSDRGRSKVIAGQDRSYEREQELAAG